MKIYEYLILWAFCMLIVTSIWMYGSGKVPDACYFAICGGILAFLQFNFWDLEEKK